MLGKLDQLKWTSGGGNNRDLAFAIVILAFGLILVAKLAPYYQPHEKSVAYNQIQTSPSVPKSVLEELSVPLLGNKEPSSRNESRPTGAAVSRTRSDRASVIERPLFDGQSVVLKVRSLNAYSSNESSQPIEVQVIALSTSSSSDIDFSQAIGGKLIGTGSANLSSKRLYINFGELVSADGQSHPIQGQAVGSENLTSGIEGDYSSGLPARLLGVTIDRAITAADQIGTAYLFSSFGPNSPNDPGAQSLRSAAMETNQMASQSIASEASKDLRDTPAEIKLPAGSVFLARILSRQNGARH